MVEVPSSVLAKGNILLLVYCFLHLKATNANIVNVFWFVKHPTDGWLRYSKICDNRLRVYTTCHLGIL